MPTLHKTVGYRSCFYSERNDVYIWVDCINGRFFLQPTSACKARGPYAAALDAAVAEESSRAIERAVDAECVRLAQMHGIDLAEIDREFVEDRLADRGVVS